MSHALLSPSSAHRWMVCPPSARLESQFPDNAGIEAKRGSLAHSLGEIMIHRALKNIAQTTYNLEEHKIKKNELYEPEMSVHCEEYKDYVLEVYNTAKTKEPDTEIFIEEKIDLSFYIPDGFGTGDVQIISDGVLDFIDLKYGKGVPVSADHNEQLMCYAAGALRKWDLLYNIETVRIHIFQPRLDNRSVFEISATDLRAWAKNKLIPAAKVAYAGDGEFNPGKKQCFFCRAKSTCRALAEYNMELAKYEFTDPMLLEDHEVSAILEKVDLFKNWIKSVQTHALITAINDGKKWPGYKVVTGRSNRKYTDQKAVAMTLNAAGVTDFYKPLEVRGITELTAMLGKKRFEELLNSFILKPPGKPVLVPESDKREPYKGDAASVFEDIDADEE